MDGGEPKVHVNRHGSVDIRGLSGSIVPEQPQRSSGGGMQTSLDQLRAIFSQASSAQAAAADSAPSPPPAPAARPSPPPARQVASSSTTSSSYAFSSQQRRSAASHSEELQRQLAMQQEKNDALIDQLHVLEAHRVGLLREKAESQTKLRQALFVCETKTTEVVELTRSVETLRSTVVQSEEDGKRVGDSASRMEWELKGLRSANAEAQRRAEESARTRVELNSALERTTVENAQLHSEIDASRGTAESRAATLAEQLRDATEELQRLRAEREPLLESERAKTAELAHSKSLLHDATRVVGAERRRVAELQEQTRADEEATRDAKVRTASLRTEVTQLRATDAILREEAKAARAQADELERSARASQRRTDELRRAVRSLELIKERNEAELASLRAALEKANEARAADRRAFESDLAGFQAEAERATATFRAVEADNTAQRAAQTEEYARQQVSSVSFVLFLFWFAHSCWSILFLLISDVFFFFFFLYCP